MNWMLRNIGFPFPRYENAVLLVILNGPMRPLGRFPPDPRMDPESGSLHSPGPIA